jgi:serine/threonine protein phosphatase PrpC
MPNVPETTSRERPTSRLRNHREQPPEMEAHPRTLRVATHGLTDRGRERAANEDQFITAEVRRVLRVTKSSIPQPESLLGEPLGHLLVVADGIGGQRGGDYASTLAVVGIENLLLNTLGWLCRLQGEGVIQELTEALRAADRWVEAAGRREDLRGMGTTVTLAYVSGDSLYVAHAGDSRCYLLRDGELARLTRDHTLVETMVSGGLISADEAEHHHMRNVVTNAVGGGKPGVEPEVHKHTVVAGDVLLLCTDGLTGHLRDPEIAEVLAGARSPEEACQLLVDEANRRGGQDNITVVIARFDEGDQSPAT